MSRPELVVPVADLERGPKHVEFALSEAWLRRALEGTDAVVIAPGKLDVTLSKNGTDVLVRGSIHADLTLPCVVTLDPVPVPVRTEILLMLSPKSASAAEGREPGTGGRRRATRPAKEKRPETGEAVAARPGRPKNTAKGEGHWDESPILTDETAGRDTFDGHEVVLDDFAREIIILELPMFPRRSDLPTDGPAANPPLPADTRPEGDKPLDPRLSPLAELKSRLEQKIKKE
jgi:uncharacterized metal-binding protein YceD (DUF177 family)